jgi:hypothetical protein
MTISYDPSRDELLREFHPVRNHLFLQFGRFTVWYEEDRICGVRIEGYMEEAAEFRRNLHRVRLGGIWKDAAVGAEDLRETRGSLLQDLDDKW